jgi:hypothetical protein
MMSQKKIFPEVKCMKGMLVHEDGSIDYHIMLETYIRKEHEGKYYLFPVMRRSIFKAGDLYTEAYNEFIMDCYKALVLYKIPQPNVSTISGQSLLIEDLDTRTEADRLRESYTPYGITKKE